MDKRRIVVTGMGMISPLGNNVDESWANARAGRSGIDWIQSLGQERVNIQIAGEVKNFDADAVLGKRSARRTDRAQQLALVAAEEALQCSGLRITEENMYDIGCIVGTGIGGVQSASAAIEGYFVKGPRGVSPLLVAPMLSDQIGAQISIDYNLRGPNYSLISACATGNNAIGDAADMIRMGRAKMMLAGGSEASLTGMVMSGLDNIKTLAAANGDPTNVARPFDLNRSGFVIAEGAGILLLEDLDHARARGATIYAELTGYGHTSDAYHVTAPRADGAAAAKAMQLALQEARLQPIELDYINAHGTGTPLNDSSETLAIKRALGEEAYNVPISSTKSMTGHLLGAAGAAEAIFSIMAIQDQFAPPTINYETPDPECDLDYIPNSGRELAIEHVMSNAFGFGGHNAVLVISRYRDAQRQ